MDGMQGVMTAVEGRLRDAMPGKLAELRTRYGIVDGSLEDIKVWLTHEPDDIGIDRPPMIVIVEQESDVLDGPAMISGDNIGGAVYRWRYRLIVFAWARGTTFDSTALVRRLYGLAVREVLLQKPGLGPTDPGTIIIDPAKIIETFSAISRDGSTREIIAATAVAVEYFTQEYLGPLLIPSGTVAATTPPVITPGP